MVKRLNFFPIAYRGQSSFRFVAPDSNSAAGGCCSEPCKSREAKSGCGTQ